jgi:hypothetical protein
VARERIGGVPIVDPGASEEVVSNTGRNEKPL